VTDDAGGPAAAESAGEAPGARGAADAVRRVREALGAAPSEVARALRVGRSSYYRFESADEAAPTWLLLALGGLGVARYGRGIAEMAALLGIDPDADPVRTPQGTYAPIVPSSAQPADGPLPPTSDGS
jgi:hypothetical protein